MEAASPARLYATVIGALLLVLGVVGFFYSASFEVSRDLPIALGVFRVNAWFNLLAIATGALGLLLADAAARPYALLVGALYAGLGIWGFAIPHPDAILGFLPANGYDDALRVAVGLLGLAAAAGTPRRASGRRRLEPRAQAVGERP
jgi:NO-binding membrane sensor protein with MHYT domain